MAMTVEAVTKGIAREEWLQLRKRGIGGSDAAAVAGLNPWKSPVAVYLEKTGQLENDAAGEPAYWGNILEDVVAKEFSIRTGLKVQRSNKLYRHPEHSFMLGNIDRMITDQNKRKGILEVKTTSAFNTEDWKDDKLPDHYAIQLQHYLSVLGLDYGFFAVLIGGNNFQYRYVERDERIISSLIDIEKQFWNEHVLKGIPPMIDGSDASTNLLNYLYPSSKPDTSINLPDDQEGLIKELKESQDALKLAETRFETAKNLIKSMMEDAEIAYFKGDKIATWKSSDSASLDTKTLKAKKPEIYSEFAVTKSVRRFLVK
ncbi:YqaJ viral recombinase family protein [Paenibacillus rigui]|uniref:YqaJ viral recombinase domain-containing protein n=1 Tax=Paenibacillus rigui TaxID=554312 RepID=A0A229UMD3_9BACL|nr:YqaJ viral recombinase family protein [Paenibacillus rigui]OXM84586.1 hypothetical protein CF651_18935 [Paenibacillus rigui]